MNALDILTRRLAKEEARRPCDWEYCQMLRESIHAEKRWLELKMLCAEFEPQLNNVTAALKRGIARKTARGEKLNGNPDKLLKALEDTSKALMKLKVCP